MRLELLAPARAPGAGNTPAPASGSLGDRVREVERSAFAGRERELRHLAALLTDSERLPHAVHVTGPPGIGKTAVLQELARRVRGGSTGDTVVIDCHDFDGSVDGFLSLLRLRAAGWPGDGASAPALLGIDSHELLTVPQARRLREEVIERITDRVLVVVAERSAPWDMLSQRAGWRACLETTPLGALADGESRLLLARRGITNEVAVAEILELAAGHPLILAVAADVALRHGERPLPAWLIAERAVRMLHLRLRRESSHPRLTDLLEATSLMPVVNHDLLAEMLGSELPDLEAAFSGLSVLDVLATGYALHEPWRRLLSDDLRRRRPQWHAELLARTRGRAGGVIPLAGGRELSLHVLHDLVDDEGPPPAAVRRTADSAARERVKLAHETLHDPRAHGDLQRRLREIIRSLAESRSPRVAQAGRVLHCYYVSRTSSLELVAERLSVSRATLFRRLTLGLTLVYERLDDGDLDEVACA